MVFSLALILHIPKEGDICLDLLKVLVFILPSNNNVAYYNVMDSGRRYKISGYGRKHSLFLINSSSQNISIISGQLSELYCSQGNIKTAKRQLHTQGVEL